MKLAVILLGAPLVAGFAPTPDDTAGSRGIDNEPWVCPCLMCENHPGEGKNMRGKKGDCPWAKDECGTCRMLSGTMPNVCGKYLDPISRFCYKDEAAKDTCEWYERKGGSSFAESDRVVKDMTCPVPGKVYNPGSPDDELPGKSARTPAVGEVPSGCCPVKDADRPRNFEAKCSCSGKDTTCVLTRTTDQQVCQVGYSKYDKMCVRSYSTCDAYPRVPLRYG